VIYSGFVNRVIHKVIHKIHIGGVCKVICDFICIDFVFAQKLNITGRYFFMVRFSVVALARIQLKMSFFKFFWKVSGLGKSSCWF